MTREIDQLLKLNLDGIAIKKFEVFDQNRSTAFTISSSTFALYKTSDGTILVSGSATPNNSDVDRAGNAIKTVAMTIDLQVTDAAVGPYYLVVQTQLTTQQLDFFRFPVELVDLRTKGVS